MAVGFAVVDARQYGGRVTAFVALSCVTAAMGGAIFGCDISTAGGVSSMDAFLQEFFPDVYRRLKCAAGVSNYCKFDSQLLTLFTSSLYITGLLTAAVPLYLSEMAPARYRGMFSNGFQFSLCLGALLATVVNYGAEKITGGWGWRLSLGLAGVPAALLTVGAIFLPETPQSLVQQGRDRGEVRALLQKIRGTDDVDQKLDDIVAANAVAQQGDNGLRLILTHRRYRPQLAMAVLIPSFTQLTGINAIGFYAPVLLRSIGMGESASLLSTIVLVIVSSAATFTSLFAADRFGRRTLLLAGGALMLVCEALIGVRAEARRRGGLSRAYSLALLLLIGVYSAAFGCSWGPLSWLVPSEIFPLEVRSAGQSITVASGFVFTVFVAQYFLAMLCRMKAWLFFFFAGWIVVMTAFVYLFLPETKRLPIEHIDKVWAEHWFWKKVIGANEDEASAKL
ncbi:unnamed protein product [Miscanthus lutarioriparius]|uniref:Major facilitator superfamily (MFS) profile domain-containing protein n=1 Tax=Miscanthus lutarioriparius TaxID=422564 RepID=A0A811Q7Y6_9POAL|nr:unnamed protein product [Miscanthus lutarioriparius]